MPWHSILVVALSLSIIYRYRVATMRPIAKVVFGASFAALGRERNPELRTLMHPHHLLELARPAGLKQNAICALWPKNGPPRPR